MACIVRSMIHVIMHARLYYVPCPPPYCEAPVAEGTPIVIGHTIWTIIVPWPHPQ